MKLNLFSALVMLAISGPMQTSADETKNGDLTLWAYPAGTTTDVEKEPNITGGSDTLSPSRAPNDYDRFSDVSAAKRFDSDYLLEEKSQAPSALPSAEPSPSPTEPTGSLSVDRGTDQGSQAPISEASLVPSAVPTTYDSASPTFNDFVWRHDGDDHVEDNTQTPSAAPSESVSLSPTVGEPSSSPEAITSLSNDRGVGLANSEMPSSSPTDMETLSPTYADGPLEGNSRAPSSSPSLEPSPFPTDGVDPFSAGGSIQDSEVPSVTPSSVPSGSETFSPTEEGSWWRVDGDDQENRKRNLSVLSSEGRDPPSEKTNKWKGNVDITGDTNEKLLSRRASEASQRPMLRGNTAQKLEASVGAIPVHRDEYPPTERTVTKRAKSV